VSFSSTRLGLALDFDPAGPPGGEALLVSRADGEAAALGVRGGDRVLATRGAALRQGAAGRDQAVDACMQVGTYSTTIVLSLNLPAYRVHAGGYLFYYYNTIPYPTCLPRACRWGGGAGWGGSRGIVGDRRRIVSSEN
jgi:hypothetical protein